MISEKTIEEVRQKAPIQEVVGWYLKLKRSGSDYEACCPFHSEKTPSFKVSPAKGIYKCFGCGKSGDAIAFVMEHEKKGFSDSVRLIAEKLNIETEEYKKREYVKPEARIEKLGKKALKFFEEERGISNNTLLRFGVTEAVEWMPQFHKETTVICFNYYRDEDLVNIKFRGAKKSFKLAKDAELIFYNLNAIKGEKECVIVEGEIDALTFHEAGIFNVVSVPNGAAKGNQRLEYLDNCFDYFAAMEKVFIATDGDHPGKILRDELVRRLGAERCWQVSYPEGCKDANDVLVKHGKDAVMALMENAKEWPVEGLVTMDEMFDDVLYFYENGYPEGAKTHIPGLDDLISFYPGQMTIITGSPGSGKSEFLDYMMVSLTRHHDWSWGVCSFESQPRFHVTKLANKFVQKSFDFRKDSSKRMNRSEFEYAIGMIDKYFHFVNISMVDITMDGLIKKAEELVKRKGINGLILDPWNCIEAKYDGSETQYVLSTLNKFLIFLEKYNVHGFIVAHPTKMKKDKNTGKYEVATMYDISGSAHFFNRTHNGMSVHRDFETGVVDVYVQKVKWEWLGRVGFASFNYDTMTRQYAPLGNNLLPKQYNIAFPEEENESPF